MFAQSEALPAMLPYVRRLKARHGLRVVAVSNEGRELTEHRIATFGLAEVFDAFVASSFVHFRKPDTDIYRLALDVAQRPPAAIVYVDDRPLFVEVARGLGLRGLVHAGYESTRDALAALGLDDG
jgi:putative hydrolase of the HAD superfamily